MDGVVWDEDHPVRWQSMPEYLNFDYIKKQIDPAEYHTPLHSTQLSQGGGAGGGCDDDSSLGAKPPKFSTTLSNFLSNEDSYGSCDFGWFTPSVSGGSIDDLASAGEGIVFTEPGAPGYPNQPLAASEYASTTNTSSLSPFSSAERASREGCTISSREDLGHASHSLSRGAGEHGASSLTSSSSKCGNSSYGVGGSNMGGVSNGYTSIGRGGHGLGRGWSGGSVAVRAPPPLRRTSAANRMPEINQWHTLHRHASSSGPLAAESEGGGICTMHLRRTSYPISTRHFPERQPEPRRSPDGSGLWAGSSGSGRGVKVNGGSPSLLGRSLRRVEDAAAAASAREAAGGWERTTFGMREVEEPHLRKGRPKSYAWALTEIRVVHGGSPWAAPRAEYLVVACLGQGKLVAGWRRATDFGRLARIARRYWMSKVRTLLVTPTIEF